MRAGYGVIAYSETRLSAVVLPGGDFRMLSVSRSVLVRYEDELYEPVREVLETNCTKEISSETVRDKEMMFGRAVRSKWMVWATCPDEPHDCADLPIPEARTGEEEIALGEVPIG